MPNSETYFLVGASFTTEFVIEAKGLNGVFWNMSNLRAYYNSVSLNFNFNCKRGFQESSPQETQFPDGSEPSKN